MLSDPKNPDWWKHSVEFCGGTHLKSMGEAQKAVIVQESAIGGNVSMWRRCLLCCGIGDPSWVWWAILACPTLLPPTTLDVMCFVANRSQTFPVKAVSYIPSQLPRVGVEPFPTTINHHQLPAALVHQQSPTAKSHRSAQRGCLPAASNRNQSCPTASRHLQLLYVSLTVRPWDFSLEEDFRSPLTVLPH